MLSQLPQTLPPLDLRNITRATRESEIRRIVYTLAGGRDSLALVGDHRTGKTTLLRLVAEVLRELQTPGLRLVPSWIDLQDRDVWTAIAFWEAALTPVARLAEPGSRMATLLARAREQRYCSDSLAELVDELSRFKSKLVLFIDEFDTLLQRPHLMTEAFLGGMRSLLSSRADAITVVYAGRCSPSDLNRHTVTLYRRGSPFFNVMQPVFIGPIVCEKLADFALDAGIRLADEDWRWIERLTGGHVGLVTSVLMQLRAEQVDTPISRALRGRLSYTLLTESRAIYEVSWADWHPRGRLALLRLTLTQLGKTLGVSITAPAFVAPEDPQFRTQLTKLLSPMLGRYHLECMLRHCNIDPYILPPTVGLPECFTLSVEALLHQGVVGPAIEYLLQNRGQRLPEIDEFTRNWGLPRNEIAAAPPIHTSEVHDLMSRGVVRASGSNEWSLRPACLFWWLTERVRDGCRLGLLPWLRGEGIDFEASPQVLQSLEAHRRLLRPFIEGDGLSTAIELSLDPVEA